MNQFTQQTKFFNHACKDTGAIVLRLARLSLRQHLIGPVASAIRYPNVPVQDEIAGDYVSAIGSAGSFLKSAIDSMIG